MAASAMQFVHEDAVVRAGGARLRSPEAAAIDCSFALKPGDLALADLAEPTFERLLCDAVSGLVLPESGEFIVLGRAWADCGESDGPYACARRGRIGRAFSAGAWIASLSIPDNLALVQRYHTRRDDEAILAEVDALCRQVGLPGLPLGPVGELGARDLACAALVRAFLGTPDLILLESTAVEATGLSPGWVLDLSRQATDRGAAVLWCTLRPTTDILALPVDRRLQLDRLIFSAMEDAP